VRLAGGYHTLIAVVPPAYNGTGTGLLPLAAGVLGASAPEHVDPRRATIRISR
jgi:hypothetical protein